MQSLDIRPIPIPEREACTIHPLLPIGSCVFVAPSGSGKTTTMLNLLLRRRYGVNTWYDVVHVFSPTVYDDPSWAILDSYRPTKIKCNDGKKRMTARINLHNGLDLDVLAQIMDGASGVTRTLIILDDCAPDLKKDTTLEKLFFTGRHTGMFCWLSSQLYRKIPRGLRVNSPYLFLFKNINSNELDTIADEIAVEEVKDFKRTYRDATREPYSFLTVDTRKSFDERYTSNFKKITR
jgi:hypothetical protein